MCPAATPLALYRLWGMYKSSELITSLHSVQKHMPNVYSSKVCLQTKLFPKISKFFFPKTLQNMIIMKNYQYFYKNNSRILDKVRKLWTNFRWTLETNLLSHCMEQSDWLRALVHSLYRYPCPLISIQWDTYLGHHTQQAAAIGFNWIIWIPLSLPLM